MDAVIHYVDIECGCHGASVKHKAPEQRHVVRTSYMGTTITTTTNK